MAEKTTENQIILTDVRLSYAYLFKAYENDTGKLSFCTHGIMDLTHPQIPAIKALMRKAADKVWKETAGDTLQQLAAQDRLCLHRGDINKPGQDAYKGKLFISASNSVRPTVVDGNRTPMVETDANAPYSGCRANLILEIWAQNNKWGKRINATLLGVQFVRHDERLSGGGRVASADEFGVVAGDADAAVPVAAGSEGLI